MAFVSVGQKYGFVSAGDVFRQKLAEAEKNGEEKAAKARSEGHADAIEVQSRGIRLLHSVPVKASASG